MEENIKNILNNKLAKYNNGNIYYSKITVNDNGFNIDIRNNI